jgi:hypothetical protein
MADDAYDDDLFDDVYVMASLDCFVHSPRPRYAGDVSSAPAPPPQSIKPEAPGARLDVDDLSYGRPSKQEASYAPDTSNQIVAIDTGNEGHAGAYGGHGVKNEPYQDEADHNGDDGYPPIGIKEDG